MIRQQGVNTNPKKKLKLVSQENCYLKDQLIGQGTFGKVYLARHKTTNRICAIKSVLQDKRYKNRQLGIISQLVHQNIIQMKDYYFTIEDSEYYLNIVMEYIPDNLQRILKDNRINKISMDPNIRKIIIFQLIKGLYYLKLRHVCHRDLKPPNILINSQTYQLKICDFGSAKIIQPGQKNVAYICSRYYRAPQLVFGSNSYSTQIDMWSTGCIIVQLITSQPIFPGDSSLQQLIEIIKVIGVPDQKYLTKYIQNSFIMPKVKSSSWNKIFQKWQVQQQLIDLIEKILTFDIENRITPFQALIHPYFKKIITFNTYLNKLPSLLNFKSLRNDQNNYEVDLLEKIYKKNNQKQENGKSMLSTFCVQ